MSADPINLATDQDVNDSQTVAVGGELSQQSTLGVAASNVDPSAADLLHPDHRAFGAHVDHVGVGPSPQTTTQRSASKLATSSADALLLIYADALDDLERVRIATENRVRSLIQVKGMEGTPEQARLEGLVDALKAQEHGCELELKRALRSHPLGPWVNRTLGIGEKQGGRLLASVGDPYWNHAADRARRGPAELWAYCGLHVLTVDQPPIVTHVPDVDGQSLHPTDHQQDDSHGAVVGGVAAKRRKGVKSNWNSNAKMRAYLCAVSCMKSLNSPYRVVYLDRRAHTAETHPDWTAGHSHNDALRVASKAILRDLYLEAKAIAGEES